jgi:hypothetical protein
MQLARFLVEAVVLGKQARISSSVNTRSRAVGFTNCWPAIVATDRLP